MKPRTKARIGTEFQVGERSLSEAAGYLKFCDTNPGRLSGRAQARTRAEKRLKAEPFGKAPSRRKAMAGKQGKLFLVTNPRRRKTIGAGVAGAGFEHQRATLANGTIGGNFAIGHRYYWRHTQTVIH